MPTCNYLFHVANCSTCRWVCLCLPNKNPCPLYSVMLQRHLQQCICYKIMFCGVHIIRIKDVQGYWLVSHNHTSRSLEWILLFICTVPVASHHFATDLVEDEFQTHWVVGCYESWDAFSFITNKMNDFLQAIKHTNT